METEKNQINKKSLRYRFTAGTIGVLLTLGAVVVSTYAWYVYNTGLIRQKYVWQPEQESICRSAMPTMVFMVLPPYWTAFPASSIRYRRTGSAEVFRKCSASQTERKTSPIWWRICLEEATTAITIKPACSCGAMENPPTSIFPISALRTAMKTIRSHQRFVQVS